MTASKHIRIVPPDAKPYRKPGCTCAFARRADGVVERVVRLDDCPVHSTFEALYGRRPTMMERAAYFARAGTSVPGSMRSLPIADRVFVAVLNGLAWVGKIWRKRK